MTATLLFDLDGTLVETDHLHHQAFSHVLADYGVSLDWDTYRRRVIGRANPVIAAEFLPHVETERHAAIMDAKEARYRGLVRNVEPAPGLVALLDWAREAGIPCAVVTNAPRPNAELLLGALGLAARFDALVIGDELENAKPHPRPYLRGLELLGGSASRSVAFEDSPSGTASAVAAGVPVVGLLTSVEAEVLREAGASLVTRDFTDAAALAFVRERTLAADPAR